MVWACQQGNCEISLGKHPVTVLAVETAPMAATSAFADCSVAREDGLGDGVGRDAQEGTRWRSVLGVVKGVSVEVATALSASVAWLGRRRGLRLREEERGWWGRAWRRGKGGVEELRLTLCLADIMFRISKIMRSDILLKHNRSAPAYTTALAAGVRRLGMESSPTGGSARNHRDHQSKTR